jgi:aspartate/methionine/tyrosine aminotransferase
VLAAGGRIRLRYKAGKENGMMDIAERMGRLGTESAFEVLARARALERQGRQVVHLEIGEPDFDTPDHIKAAAKRALDAGVTHYGPSAGIPELRDAIARHVAETRGIEVAPDEVVVTPGAKPIMFFTILALVNRGDEVIYPNPGFPIYESVVNFVGGVPVPIPLTEETGFGFDLAELERRVSRKTRLIIINSPENPTGGVLDPDDIGRIAELARHYRVPVLSDEIYRRFLYEGRFASIASLPGMKPQTIILDGFSKSYAMTGWRLGYGVMPPALAEHMTRLMTNSASCTATFIQHAGVAALQGDDAPVREMVEEFRLRRDLMVDGLNRIPGVTCQRPRGAFYVFPSVRALRRPSKEIATYLLDEAGVAVLWGTAFGEFGEGYLRLSYAASREAIGRALEAMQKALARLA